MPSPTPRPLDGRPVAVGHVGVNVVDLDRSVAFYRDVIGLDVIAVTEGRFAFCGLGETLAVTLWQQAAADHATDRAGLHHLAFELADVAALDAAASRLRAAGIELVHDGVVAHAEGADSGGIFFHDPDGTRLELYVTAGLAGAHAPSGEAPTCGFF
ncbi:MAG: VOC family protein [Actinomycetota bacterium]|nr:VOC family protein [Actinomycetota bacterium]